MEKPKFDQVFYRQSRRQKSNLLTLVDFYSFFNCSRKEGDDERGDEKAHQ